MMKKINYNYILTVLLGSSLLLSGCGNEEEQQPQGQNAQTPTLPIVVVPTKTVTGYKAYPASIEGVINSDVRAKVQGYIQEVLVDEGEKVAKGQPLFKLETQSLSQDANAAEANVNAAQVEVDKLKPLVEKDIISEVQLETAKAQLQQAKSNYSSINANIDYATVKSPVDGYVGSIPYRQGNLVGPTDQTPLTVVADISKVYSYFSMNEKEYLNFIQEAEGGDISERIKNLPKVTLILANGSTYNQEGTIQTVNSQVNQNSGSVSFRAIFDNPSRILTNGNSGTIRIPQTYEDAVIIPRASTFERQGGTFVYKLGTDSMAVAAEFKIKDEVGNLYVAQSGVEKGDKIVAKGLGKLRGETKIKPQEVPFDSIAKPIDKVFN